MMLHSKAKPKDALERGYTKGSSSGAHAISRPFECRTESKAAFCG